MSLDTRRCSHQGANNVAGPFQVSSSMLTFVLSRQIIRHLIVERCGKWGLVRVLRRCSVRLHTCKVKRRCSKLKIALVSFQTYSPVISSSKFKVNGPMLPNVILAVIAILGPLFMLDTVFSCLTNACLNSRFQLAFHQGGECNSTDCDCQLESACHCTDVCCILRGAVGNVW